MMTTRNYTAPEYSGYTRTIPAAPLEPFKSYGYGRSQVEPYYPPPTSSLAYIAPPISPEYSPLSSAATRAGTNGYGSSSTSVNQGYSYGSQPIVSGRDVRRRSPEEMDIEYSDPRASEPKYTSGRTSSSSISRESRQTRRPSNRDEFDGQNQYLPPLPTAYVAAQERDIPHLPTNLIVQEQDEILSNVNDRLSRCAYDFVAKYEFPIPVDPKMRPVTRPEDREWTEWVYLLKRLATKRRIPARLLYQGQIKQLVTILENSLEMRHAAKHQSRPLKDDRNVLQLISAGIQVAKILKDAPAVEFLDQLYTETDMKIAARASRRR